MGGGRGAQDDGEPHQALGAHQAGLDGLDGLVAFAHRQQRDDGAIRQVDVHDGLTGLVQHQPLRQLDPAQVGPQARQGRSGEGGEQGGPPARLHAMPLGESGSGAR